MGTGSAFGSTSTLGNNSNAFGATTNVGGAFGQTSSLSSNSGFGSHSNTTGLGAANNNNNNNTTTATVSAGNDVTKPSDLESFSAPQFTYRAIPEIEPPAQFR
ncbi:uncharacterized protein B0P05DRAFT_562637 [Gilbertella persicaria]|uniref:uncharacterized protein n=1 Tax=Gilbertella persicaria TaxID=101096 RepID=UPI00221FC4A8|nr:uncharacterized protein B0P05DRAFT_562637 [Gilbertella persicaria]KAI8051408.1 hypothetical protein B0P05DRAFT_562637 [Gilbertella persicaria]